MWLTSATQRGEIKLMDMSGERHIPAPRPKVWQALNDPEVLKASIPGCESLEKTGENELKAAASVKIGPISAKFTGKVQLSDLDPPNGYTISGEGQGGGRRLRKGRCDRETERRRRRDLIKVRRKGAGWWQNCTTRRAAN